MGREYISQCVKALSDDPEAVLAFVNQTHIDEKGDVLQRLHNHNPGASDSPNERLHDILRDDWCHPIYGVMRTEVVRQTGLHQGFADYDRVFLAEMGLRGRFRLLPAYLFSRRVSSQGSSKYNDLRERTLFYDTSKIGTLIFPVLLQTGAFFSAIRRAGLPLTERFSCYGVLLRWLWTEHRFHLRDELCDKALSTLLGYLSEDQLRRLKPAEARLLKAWSAK